MKNKYCKRKSGKGLQKRKSYLWLLTRTRFEKKNPHEGNGVQA